MTSDRDIQVSFFKWVKEKSDPKSALADELAALLDISRDSSYRRLRGETLLTFNEISKISAHFGISLDSYLNLATNAVVFNSRTIKSAFTFKNYLLSIDDNLKMIQQFGNQRITYVAKDVPLFHYFRFPSLTAFKSFFWLKSILNSPDYSDISRYDPNVLDPEILSISQSIWKNNLKIPSLEIWSDETINITLRQINYYFECNILSSDQALAILDELKKLVLQVNMEAKHGVKLLNSQNPTQQSMPTGEYLLYYNEIEIGDNTIFFSMDDKRTVFKTYNMLNTLSTSDEVFCNDTENYINSMLGKSVPMSTTSEKARSQFFYKMETKIQALESSIKAH